MHPTKMNFEAWTHHVMGCAETMTRKLINFREVEFQWAERYQDHEPLISVIDALVSAGLAQVVEAVGEASGQKLVVEARTMGPLGRAGGRSVYCPHSGEALEG